VRIDAVDIARAECDSEGGSIAGDTKHHIPREAMRPGDLGQEMLALIARLFPICRSITGEGFRQTLRILREYIPLEMREVPSGTEVFDWTVPREWNIRDAYIKNARGERVVDFQRSNLHVVNYSTPIHASVSLAELKEHLFTVPDHPEWIPYRTTYYQDGWGFCLSQGQLDALQDEEYEVCIDSSLEEGHLTYGELYLPGETTDEILISCHACHPSLCNDNLSGVALATFLAQTLQTLPRRYAYRFLFIPGTIGAITWLCLNEESVRRIAHGLVLACTGDAGRPTYKRSRRGGAEIDRTMAHVLQHSGRPYEMVDFTPYGYDERQYCSPGFNLPVGCFMRTPHGRYPEYHTSADNLNLMSCTGLADSYALCLATLTLLEQNHAYVNRHGKCEPQLGKRGLYRQIGGQTGTAIDERALLWVLNLSDGAHTLLDIAERASLPFVAIHQAAQALLEHGLLVETRARARSTGVEAV
jgi:aminopeptidase-like protein